MDSLPRSVAPGESPMRSSHVEHWLLIGWIAIAFKCAAVWWVCLRYAVPVHPLWVIVPTVLMAALGTFIYLKKRNHSE